MWRNLSKKFLASSKSYDLQYASYYAVRLSHMKQLIEKRVKESFGKHVQIKKLSELTDEEIDNECIIIGTICKNQKLKPSILKEISDEYQLIVQPSSDRFFSEDDEIILEDELQRIHLSGNIDSNELVNGVVLAGYGKESADGKFEVQKVLYAGPGSQSPFISLSESSYILFISGISLTGKANHLIYLQLLINMIKDMIITDQFKNISRIIIAGNSLKSSSLCSELRPKPKYLTQDIQIETIDAINLLDEMLLQLTLYSEVDILPGEFDPSNFHLPQQPFHPCMFTLSTNSSSKLHLVTNPYECLVENIRILGTAGQNINDIRKFCKLDNSLEIMMKVLEWGHLSPTSPDTLGCYPFSESDPFIISECPHILFTGNQKCFETDIWNGDNGQHVRLIALPKFNENPVAVFVNLQSLDCELLNFHDFIGPHL